MDTHWHRVCAYLRDVKCPQTLGTYPGFSSSEGKIGKSIGTSTRRIDIEVAPQKSQN
jgi:hypothetical protein